MEGRNYTSEAIILAKKNYSEADKIIIVYSKHKGKMSLLAKGARKPKSRKRASLEVFNMIRYSASRGRGFDIVTETEILESNSLIRKNLKKITLAYYFMEVIGKITREGERNEGLYLLLANYLNKLKTDSNLKELRYKFIYELLVDLGYWPKGKHLDNPDYTLENTIERSLTSVRVGKKMLE